MDQITIDDLIIGLSKIVIVKCDEMKTYKMNFLSQASEQASPRILATHTQVLKSSCDVHQLRSNCKWKLMRQKFKNENQNYTQTAI